MKTEKNKRTAALLISILLLLVFVSASGCTARKNDANSMTEKTESVSPTGAPQSNTVPDEKLNAVSCAIAEAGFFKVEKGTMNHLLSLCEDISLDALTVYDYEDFKSTCAYPFVLEMSSFSYYLSDYNARFPIQYIEKVDDTHVCVIYKFTDENGETFFLNLLFKNMVEDYVSHDPSHSLDLRYLENYEIWRYTYSGDE